MENVRAGTTYIVAPTIEEIIRECDEAWVQAKQLRRECLARPGGSSRGGTSRGEPLHIHGAPETDDGTRGENIVYETLIRDHQELNKTYPVILASMAAGSYNQRAVIKFFKYVRDHPWHGEKEFLETQTVYSEILYKATHAHANQKAAKNAREQVRNALTENEQKTKEQLEQVQRLAEENNKRHAKERISDMLMRVPRDAAILTRGEIRPIVVSFDDS